MSSSPFTLHTLPSSLTKPEGAQSVLEVASGTGEHTSHFAAAFPGTSFQPTDLTPELFPSIAAHALGLPNVQAPKLLDASQARAPAALSLALPLHRRPVGEGGHPLAAALRLLLQLRASSFIAAVLLQPQDSRCCEAVVDCKPHTLPCNVYLFFVGSFCHQSLVPPVCTSVCCVLTPLVPL